jgi:hypothetical protein
LTAPVVPLRAAGGTAGAAPEALAAAHRHLDRCKLSANTVKAYKRHTTAYAGWLAANASAHGDAFADLVGAEGAVTAERYRRGETSQRAAYTDNPFRPR